MKPLEIAFFGSSLVSAYWNGAATYYRGIVRALADHGHHITFYEPDVYDRQKHRDMEDPEWARVVVYAPTSEAAVIETVHRARGADVVIKTSGVGCYDDLLEATVLTLRNDRTRVIFWDVDAPATLDRLENNRADAFRGLIPYYDFFLTYGGGPAVIAAYQNLGARACIPIYNALDPHTHFPTTPDKRFECDLAFLGNRLPDREARVQEFFLTAAELLPDNFFVLGGSGWGDKQLPPNVRYVGHVFTQDHNAFNCTPKAVLNVNRDSMARYGFSPPTRVFEAAGAGACLITDAWKGIDQFFMPGTEVLVASSGEDVARYVSELTRDHSRKIGESARRRVLTEHTYQQRVAVLESVLSDGPRALVPLEREAV